MAQQVTAEQFPGYKRMFDRFDRNRNGFLSSTEWGVALRRMGTAADETEVEKQIKEVDADLDGALNFSEFVHRMGRRMKKAMMESDNDKVFEFAFTVYDKDDNGCISADELRLLMTVFGENITDEEINKMLTDADIDLGNQDGRVSKEEFVKMMKFKYMPASK